MDRKGGISGHILTGLISVFVSACNPISQHAEIKIDIAGKEFRTKASMPQEEKISDMNILIFNSRGDLEHSVFSNEQNCRVSLLKGESYTFCAFINFGYKISASTLEELKGTCHYLAYPDEYREGIPMYAVLEAHLVTREEEITLEPERLMAKISIRMDRSRLSEDVNAEVTVVRIGNCPKKIHIFRQSRAESEDDCFSSGFAHSGSECSALNRENSARLSESLSLYMFENMQGAFSDKTIDNDDEKVFEEYDIRKKTCSYIEIEIDYSSDSWVSGSEPLIYRFYLGEGRNSLDIERNCHYRITICPKDEGLDGDGWRVDKSGLRYTGETSLVQYPDGYIRGDIGDRIHIGCTLTPVHASFDVGREYMEADKAEGIYDYTIDADGHGAVLTLTGPGRGLIYMEAGEPINDAALFVIEVNTPS